MPSVIEFKRTIDQNHSSHAASRVRRQTYKSTGSLSKLQTRDDKKNCVFVSFTQSSFVGLSVMLCSNDSFRCISFTRRVIHTATIQISIYIQCSAILFRIVEYFKFHRTIITLPSQNGWCVSGIHVCVVQKCMWVTRDDCRWEEKKTQQEACWNEFATATVMLILWNRFEHVLSSFCLLCAHVMHTADWKCVLKYTVCIDRYIKKTWVYVRFVGRIVGSYSSTVNSERLRVEQTTTEKKTTNKKKKTTSENYKYGLSVLVKKSTNKLSCVRIKEICVNCVYL